MDPFYEFVQSENYFLKLYIQKQRIKQLYMQRQTIIGGIIMHFKKRGRNHVIIIARRIPVVSIQSLIVFIIILTVIDAVL